MQLEAFESNCWPDCYITVNNKINASTKIPRFGITKALWTDCVSVCGWQVSFY